MSTRMISLLTVINFMPEFFQSRVDPIQVTSLIYIILNKKWYPPGQTSGTKLVSCAGRLVFLAF
jgi:hypothetical protein